MQEVTRVIVVGAGVIGLGIAWELQQRGVDVVVVEPDGVGLGCSAGNAGWISPGISTPLPSPGLPMRTLRWMMKSDSPLYMKPSLQPSFLRFMFQFWRHCNARDFTLGTAAMAALNASTMPTFDAWKAQGIEFEMHEDGLLYVGLDADGVREMARSVNAVPTLGYGDLEVLTGSAIRDLEPALSTRVGGAFLMHRERTVRPETVCDGLWMALEANGATLHVGRMIGGVVQQGHLHQVQTSHGTVEGDVVVIATGAWLGQTTELIGVKLPIQAGKGYSVTSAYTGTLPKHPLDVMEASMAITPFDGALRFAGTMELSGINLQMRPERVEAIRRGAATFLHDVTPGETQDVWVGMRPLTPDGLPVIGKLAALDNVYVAGGHQMLGVTLAAATAHNLARQIVEGTPPVELLAFSPARFGA